MLALLLLLLFRFSSGAVIILNDTSVSMSSVLRSLQTNDVLRLGPGVFRGAPNCDLSLSVSASIIGNGQTIIDCAGIQKRCLTVNGVNAHLENIVFRNGQAPVSNFAQRRVSQGKRLPMKRLSPNRRVVSVIVVTMSDDGDLLSESHRQKHKRKTRRKTPTTISAVLNIVRAPTDGAGGCVLIRGGANVTMTDLEVSGGSATQGGGIAVVEWSSIQMVRVSCHHNSISLQTTNNIAAAGAGLFVSSSTASISDSSFNENWMGLSGGVLEGSGAGVALVQTWNVTLSGTISISGNFISVYSVGPTCVISAAGISILSNIGTLKISGVLIVTNNEISIETRPMNVLTTYGVGMAVREAHTVSISGHLSAINNTIHTIVSVRDSVNINGVGLCLRNIAILLLAADVDSSLNSLSATITSILVGDSLMAGAGIYIIGVASGVISGELRLMHNRIGIVGDSSFIGGTGLVVAQSSNLKIESLKAIGNNVSVFSSVYRSAIYGSLVLWLCNDLHLSRSVLIDSNSVHSSGGSSMQGLGSTLLGCSNVVIGPMVISNNSATRVNSPGLTWGGGMYAVVMVNLSWSAPALFTKNSIVSETLSSLSGAGLFLYKSPGLEITARLEFVGNTLSGTTDAQIFSAGLVSYVCDKIIFHDIVAINNSIFVPRPVIATDPSAPVYQIPETNTTQCSGYIEVSQQSGTISDGRLGPYADGSECGWRIALEAIGARTYGRFRLEFLLLDLVSSSFSYDANLSIYDGTCTTARLLGTWSGSLAAPYCVRGACIDIRSPFFTTSTKVFVVFKCGSNYENREGFRLAWTTVASQGRRVGLPGIFPPLDIFSSLLLGGVGVAGGVLFLQSNAHVYSATIANNTIDHPVMAIGGGLVVMNGAVVSIIDAKIKFNRVQGRIAGGGGLASTVTSTQTLIHRSEISSNEAVASGRCYTSSDEEVRCPIAFGGGALSAAGSYTAVDSLIGYNSVRCSDSDTFGCTVGGGGVGVTQNGVATVLRTECRGNIASCSSLDDSCVWSAGGCYFGDEGEIRVLESATNANQVFGVGGGGGLYTSGTLVVSVSNSSFDQNSARVGGGIWARDSSTLLVSRTSLIDNDAGAAGGALAVAGNAKVFVTDSTLVNNTAKRASSIIAYNDNEIGLYHLERTTVISSRGTVALMLGRNNFSEVTWQCTHEGSIYIPDDTNQQYFSVNFDICNEGTFAVSPGSSLLPSQRCVSCPFGAKCIGSTPTSNGLRALRGFWGRVSANGTAIFFQCPEGYCCGKSAAEGGCDFDHCEGQRTGPLCGQCPYGYGLRFFSENCGPNETCQDLHWLVPMIIIYGFGFGAFLIFSTGKPAKGMLGVLLFFYQSLPFAKSSPWTDPILSPIVLTLQSIFSLSPSASGGSSDSAGLCLFPSMDAAQKLGAKIMLPFVAVGALLVYFLLHNILHRCASLFRDRHVRRSHYLATLVRLLTISYTTFVLVPLKMLQCIFIGGDHPVWFADASVTCLARWQYLPLIAIVCLVPLPMVLMIVMWKWRAQKRAVGVETWKTAIRNVLVTGLREQTRWWLGLSLYRRLLLVFVSTLILDLNWRAIAVTTLLSVYIILALLFRPFEDSIVQWAECGSLFVLSLLSILSSPQLSQIEFGTGKEVGNAEGLEWVQTVMALGPLATFGIYSFGSAIADWRARKFLTAIAAERGEGEEGEGEVCRACAENGFLLGCENHQFC